MKTDKAITPEQSGTDDKASVLKAHLMGKYYAYIAKTGDDLSFENPVYAVNWFDTKTQWVYDFYNILAIRSVKAIDGAPFFKGLWRETLSGTAADQRQVILIVRYPSLDDFKTMLQSKFFQMVSVFRIFAVRDFTFGFTQRLDDGPDLSPPQQQAAYAVHHYRGETGIIEQIKKFAVAHMIELFYAGKTGAHVYLGDKADMGEQNPCLMDNIVVLKSDDAERLADALRSDSYMAIAAKTDSSFIGLFDRVL